MDINQTLFVFSLFMGFIVLAPSYAGYAIARARGSGSRIGWDYSLICAVIGVVYLMVSVDRRSTDDDIAHAMEKPISPTTEYINKLSF
jgi:hypothetical protein